MQRWLKGRKRFPREALKFRRKNIEFQNTRKCEDSSENGFKFLRNRMMLSGGAEFCIVESRKRRNYVKIPPLNSSTSLRHDSWKRKS